MPCVWFVSFSTGFLYRPIVVTTAERIKQLFEALCRKVSERNASAVSMVYLYVIEEGENVEIV